ncbi:sialidase family protein [Maritalea sp.]|uniref:sialidase family protein n=1 Tax=Maritalea sp. TaxID=2003361 RepID=UPI003EF123EC
MRLSKKITIYANPDPLLISQQAIFPGIVQLEDDSLLAIFSIGQAFDAADHRAFISTSTDLGQSWTAPKRLHHHEFQPHPISETMKPLLLADGNLLATGYGFVRHTDLAPIVDPDTFAVLPLRNLVSRSVDNGQNWEVPNLVDITGQPLEMSGPCIQLQCGRILAAAPPFHLGEDGHSGWIIFSDNSGQRWEKLTTFFESPGGEIAAWECRLCETRPGQVVVLFWAYDNKTKTNLNNHVAISYDAGQSFEPAIDTGVRGQASNLMRLADDKILTIHAHREDPAGLWVRQVDISDGRFKIESELSLFSDDHMKSDATDIKKQFGSLKFGQPSLLQLSNGQVLAAYWAVEECQHVIKGCILDL